MAGGTRTIRIAFAGSASGLDNTVAGVDRGLRRVENSTQEATSRLDRFGEAADTADTRAMGYRDTLTGIQDGTEGVKRAMSGDWGFETLLLLGFAVGDLGSGIFNFLVPALQAFSLASIRAKAAAISQAVATKSVSAATKVWAGIQAVFNAVMAINPVVLIVIGIIALIAVIVIAYRRSETFRRIVQAAFAGVGSAVRTVWQWIRRNWPLLLAIITGPIGIAVRLVTRNWDRIRNGASTAKNWIVRIFRNVASVISAPFRAGFNAIRAAWNSTVGGRGFTVPSWIPGLGGKSFRIPKFHSGGVVPGPFGAERLILARAGETIRTPAQEAALGAAVPEVHVYIGDQELRDVVRVEIRNRDRGLKRRALAGTGAVA
jgi:hypothetical protein